MYMNETQQIIKLLEIFGDLYIYNKPESNDKILYKIDCENHPYIFTNLKSVHEYIKNYTEHINGYYTFLLIKNKIKISLCFYTDKKLMTYLLEKYIKYELL
jgi:hypothetical protein